MAALAQLDLGVTRAGEEQMGVRVDQAGRDRSAPRIESGQRLRSDTQLVQLALDVAQPSDGDDAAFIGRQGQPVRATEVRRIVGGQQPDLGLAAAPRTPPASVAISVALWTSRPGGSAVIAGPSGASARSVSPGLGALGLREAQLERHGRLEVADLQPAGRRA